MVQHDRRCGRADRIGNLHKQGEISVDLHMPPERRDLLGRRKDEPTKTRGVAISDALRIEPDPPHAGVVKRL
jgi:hypothetical protein